MSLWTVAVVVSGLAFGFAAPSTAQPMRFAPAGDALIATGTVDRDAWRNLRAALGPEVRRIVFDSPGGLVTAAITLGAAIREAGLATEVAPGGRCASACVHALAGGVARRVPADARIAIHRLHARDADGRPIELAPERRRALNAYVAAHYRDMGLDPGLAIAADAVPPAAERVLDRAEIARYRLETEAAAFVLSNGRLALAGRPH